MVPLLFTVCTVQLEWIFSVPVCQLFIQLLAFPVAMIRQQQQIYIFGTLALALVVVVTQEFVVTQEWDQFKCLQCPKDDNLMCFNNRLVRPSLFRYFEFLQDNGDCLMAV